MAKRQTAAKAAPAAAATAEKQGSLPAGASDAAATAAALEGGELAVQPIASAGTPGLAAVDPAAGTTLVQPTASEAPVAGAAPEPDTTGGTTGQDAHLILSTEGERPVPGAAQQPVAGTGASEDEEVEALFIRAVPEQGFRRCGHRFTREGHGIAVSLLSDEQIDALYADPNLVVEHCSFPLKDVS
ncbi:HI1506-related protein [Pseudomonas nitroreducens]|uniref:HI1506-related protein n=1 Tax=Pseudomonas nitroreducens TaxID=46680 RepID=UPI002FE2E43F